MTNRALIIGGGMGGLAAAIGLRDAGNDVAVFERNEVAAAERGFGIMIWPNGMRALKQLGVADAVYAAGCELNRVEFRSNTGTRLLDWNVGELGKGLGVPAVSVARAAVHRALADKLGPESVTFGSWCTGVEQDEQSVTVNFRDQLPERGDFVIGADGVRSAIRGEHLGAAWPQFPPYAGYTIWHAVIENADIDIPAGTFYQFLGKGSRLIAARIAPNRIYWSALGFVPQGGIGEDPSFLDTVKERFSGWADPVSALFEATRPDEVARRDIFGGVALDRWGFGRLTLLGDAAHPMTTVLGQGGCMALEDAAVLSQSVAAEPDITRALRQYEQRRIQRTTEMMNLIKKFNPGGRETSIKVAVRNQMIKRAFHRGLGGQYVNFVRQPA